MSTASVVIATYNRALLLDDCLRHLARMRFVPGDEVIVADNGSTDDTRAVLAAHARTFPVPLLRVHEPRPGKSHAVAAALRVAQGHLVALTDDDVQVEPGWLEALRAALASPDVALAGGPVLPRWERRPPRWLAFTSGCQGRLGAPLGLLDYGEAPAPLGARTLLGANMALRRTVVEDLGGFAPHLGKLRGTLLSGEDHELCARVQAAGLGAIYTPAARVRHWVPASRMRVAYFLHWFYWSGITAATMDGEGHGVRTVLGVPRHLLRQFATGLLGATGALLRGRLSASVDRALDTAFAAGYTACRLGFVAGAVPPAPRVARIV